MARIYKHFARAGIVFCVGLTLAFGGIILGAQAQDTGSFTVEGVQVDVTAKNAVEARTKALDEAQVKAYKMWLEKNLGQDKSAEQGDIDPLAVSAMVQDFEVTNEQISAVRYKGTFTVRFRPSSLRHLLPVTQTAMAEETVGADTSGTSSVATPAATVASVPVKKGSTLVLPFYQSGGRTTLWEGNNPFRAAWSRQPLGENRDFSLPLGDLTDIGQIKDDQPLTYDLEKMIRLLARYQADYAAIVMASPNAVGGLDVNIYSAAPGTRPRFIRTLQIMPDQTNTPVAVLFDRAVAQVKPILKGVSMNSASAPQPAGTQTTSDPRPSGPAQNYQARVFFASAQEWVKMKHTLDRLAGMQGVMVKSLTSRSALVDMNFTGDISTLSATLRQAGLNGVPVTPQNTTSGVSLSNSIDIFTGMGRI
ncbi:MAG: DUF2066 domain-containing protein [Alphaproteobacteria bacterium]|nr:DUF2066 domain-containing protein [Alphaproteobacteria bacterium]